MESATRECCQGLFCAWLHRPYQLMSSLRLSVDHVAEFYQLRQGKITRLHAYYDTATMMRQLGVLPARGSSGERAMNALMGLSAKAVRVLKRA